MLRKVNFEQNQIVTPEDANNLGTFPREAFDTLVRDAVTDGKAYVAFNVVQSAPAEVTVGAGRFYRNGISYFRDDEGGVTLDLLELLPVVTKKKVAIVVWGNEINTMVEPRTFFVDVDTDETQGQEVATESRRVAYLDRIPGVENADPQAPSVDANVLVIAYVTLTTTGIQSIEMVAENRLVSVKTLNTRLTLVERRLDLIGPQLDTLRSDIAGLSAALETKVDYSAFLALSASHLALEARVRDLELRVGVLEHNVSNSLNFVDASTDLFIDTSLSDTAHGDYDAYVKDGLWFSRGGSDNFALALLNPLDNRIEVNDNMVSAKITPVKRISIVGRDGEIALASYTTSTTNTVQKVRTRVVVDHNAKAPTVTVGAKGGYGEAYEVLDLTGFYIQERWDDGKIKRLERTNPDTDVTEVLTWPVFGDPDNPKYKPSTVRMDGEDGAVRYFTITTIVEPYTDIQTVPSNVSGFQVAQTFLNSQAGDLLSLNLYFTEKAATGDVKVLITGLNADGTPNPEDVIATKTLTPADLQVYPNPTPVAFTPTTLVKGRNYSFYIASPGSHRLATVSNNKYGQGAMYVKINGAMVQQAVGVDLPFEAFFAGYTQTRVEVPLEPVSLAGGIEAITFNYDVALHEGTSIQMQGQVSGQWVDLPYKQERGSGYNPLASGPELMPLRAILLGTTDAMPSFGIGPVRSSVKVANSTSGCTHISTALTPVSSVDKIVIEVRAIGFDSDDHTLACTLLTGGGYSTTETPDATVDLVADASGVRRRYTFDVSPAVSTYKIKLVGATSDPTKAFMIAHRVAQTYT